MQNDKYMRQCRLHKVINENKYLEMTSWIPERIAKLHRVVRLQEEDGSWTEGWKVVSVGAREKAEIVHQRSRYHLTQRKASDI